LHKLNKSGKIQIRGHELERHDRTAEKSNKSNLVCDAKREIATRTASGETINVMVAKNTMGGTGIFRQAMEPQFFRVSDMD
jgi:hypothetical protein